MVAASTRACSRATSSSCLAMDASKARSEAVPSATALAAASCLDAATAAAASAASASAERART